MNFFFLQTINSTVIIILLLYYKFIHTGEDIPDEDDIYNVNISLKKILILYACHNLNLWNLFDLLFLNIEQFPSLAPDNKGIPTEVCF